MTYIDVQWHHSPAGEPIRLVSELDAERWERRKLEFFPDGRVGYASQTDTMHGTRLGEAPVPPLLEINAQAEFDGTELDATVFELLWSTYARAAR
jgi:hypothetical protein